MTKFKKWLSIFSIFASACIIIIPPVTVLTLKSQEKNSDNAPKSLKNFQSILNDDGANLNGNSSIMPSQLNNENFISNVIGFPSIPKGININVTFIMQSSSSNANGKDDTNGTANVSFSLSQDGYTLNTKPITIKGFQTTIENQFNENVSISLNSNFVILPNPSPNIGVPATTLPSYFNVKYLNNISSSTYNFVKYQISLISSSTNSINLKIWANTGSASNLFSTTFVVTGFAIVGSTNDLITQYINYIANSEVDSISFSPSVTQLFQENKINASNFSDANLLTALNIDSIPAIKSIISQSNFKDVVIKINNWNSQTFTFSITLTNSINQQTLSTNTISIRIPSVNNSTTSVN